LAIEAIVAGSSSITIANITLYLSIAAALISGATFTAGYSQMKIASAKVKLDLYNKRFNVYLATLEHYQSAYGKVEGSMKSKSIAFIKCHRESQFLLATNDGIFETLTRIMTNGNAIIVYEDSISNSQPNTSSETRYLLHEKSIDARLNFEKDLLILEKQMAKHIDFSVVRGWTFF
jgi:transcriptional antiterminator